MKKILINFADEKFESAQKYCTKMAYKKGKFDEVWEYTPADVEDWMYNGDTLKVGKNADRIGKYGLWRPYIIYDALEKMEEDDYLFYCDSGAYFNKNVNELIKVFEEDKLYIMCFDIPTLEKQWTKRDIFVYLDADKEYITNTAQRMSGMFLTKKCKESKAFFNTFYKISCDMPKLFTDADNELGQSNYENFIDNRHNQSVFSVLTKKFQIEAYKDPTEFGDYPQFYALNKEYVYVPTRNKPTSYRKVIISHRYPKITFYRKMKLKIRSIVPIKIYFDISFFLAKIRNKFEN